MKDPYSLLDVARDADPDVIKQAYRRLAKKLHPDRNLGDPRAEQRFKDVTQAYNLLSDRKARQAFDRGRIDANGQKIRPSFRQKASRGQDNAGWGHGIETIFERVMGKFGLNGNGKASFGREPASNGSPKTARESHDPKYRENGQHHRLDVDFLTAVRGGKQRINTDDGRTLEIDIPPGTADNTLLRLKGQGHRQSRKLGPKHQGDERSDLLISIKVSDHPLFTRRGQDLYLDLPISIREALFGAKVRTPTIEGAVWLAIPAKANSGQILRLKGKGVVDRHGTRGDQYVRLMVTLPKDPNAAMTADLERLAGHNDYHVRAHLDGY